MGIGGFFRAIGSAFSELPVAARVGAVVAAPALAIPLGLMRGGEKAAEKNPGVPPQQMTTGYDPAMADPSLPMITDADLNKSIYDMNLTPTSTGAPPPAEQQPGALTFDQRAAIGSEWERKSGNDASTDVEALKYQMIRG